MISCRTFACSALVPEGQFYCESCGGLARAKAEGLLDPKPAKEAKKTAFKEDSRGAVPVGQGLSRFSSRAETPEERAKRKAQAAKNRADREKEQKAWLSTIPKRGESNQTGTGTSKKARKRQKTGRKLRQRRR